MRAIQESQNETNKMLDQFFADKKLRKSEEGEKDFE
jgi:hypothetical protein